MNTILTILIIIAAILLIVVVLLQPGKGDLSASFGGLGGQMGSMFGMQRTANLLQKITRYIAIAILVIAFIINKFYLYDDADTQQRVNTVLNQRTAQQGQPMQAPQQQMPGQQAQQQPAQKAQPAQQPAQQQQPAQKPAK